MKMRPEMLTRVDCLTILSNNLSGSTLHRSLQISFSRLWIYPSRALTFITRQDGNLVQRYVCINYFLAKP